MGAACRSKFPSLKRSTVNPWPADKIERRKVADLKPHPRNARTHSPEQIDQIAKAIEQWGWTTPVLVTPDGTIVAGHGRVSAAQKLGIESVPVMVAKGWSQAQIRAYVIADNQIAANSGWDEEMLRFEIADLGQADFDLGLMGFSDEQMADFMKTPAAVEAPDQFPSFDENIETEHCCPKCGYAWSGKAS